MLAVSFLGSLHTVIQEMLDLNVLGGHCRMYLLRNQEKMRSATIKHFC